MISGRKPIILPVTTPQPLAGLFLVSAKQVTRWEISQPDIPGG